MSEQASSDMRAFAIHDHAGSVRVPQVVMLPIRHGSGRVARLDPEPHKSSLLNGPLPLPPTPRDTPFSEPVPPLPRSLAEQNVHRSGLRVNQGEPVRLDFGPAQAAYLSRPASGQQEQPHRRDADRVFFLALAQDRAELCQIVRAEQPPARRTAIADDARARVAHSFGPMAPRDGAVEHVAQYVMTPIRAVRLAASAFVDEAGNVGTQQRSDAQMAERRQDGTVGVAQCCLDRGRLPRGRAPLDEFGGELRQRRAGSGKGHRTPAALLAHEEGERGDACLVGLHRVRLTECDLARLTVAPEAAHPGSLAVDLDPEHEAMQGGMADRVFTLARLDREREPIGHADALGQRSDLPPSSISARPCETRLAASNTEPSASRA